jgi:hypothetical protein
VNDCAFCAAQRSKRKMNLRRTLLAMGSSVRPILEQINRLENRSRLHDDTMTAFQESVF